MDQIILACDDEGNFLEYIPKDAGHTGEGRRHLAITVLLCNSKGQVLLQKRKHKIFDKYWDITAATHPLHLADGSDESLEEATRRALLAEYEVREIRGIRVIGKFNYSAKYGDLCENEHCAILVGEYNGSITMDPSIGYEYKWMDKEEFLRDIEANPQNYTPWANEGLKLLKNVDFFR